MQFNSWNLKATLRRSLDGLLLEDGCELQTEGRYPAIMDLSTGDLAHEPTSPALSSSSTLYEPEGLPESLVFAVLASDLLRVEWLASLRIGVSNEDAWIIYEACLQGPSMIHALSSNPEIDIDPVLPGHLGDSVFHFILRTSANRFLVSKATTIKFLLRKGVNPLRLDRFGNNALHILAEINDVDESVLELVLGRVSEICDSRAGVLDTVNKKNHSSAITSTSDGSTPLMVAVQNNNVSRVRLFLNHGADPRISGCFGYEPLSVALLRGYHETAEVLQQHMLSLQKESQ